MTIGPDALRRLSTLLDEAFAVDAGQRDAWVAGLQGDDAALAPTLRELLARHALVETTDVLGRVRGLTGLATPDDAGSARAGDTVGPYRLERLLGRGGMGEVWLAARIDGALKRKVALKLPHVTWAPGMAERFAREREILSGLEHPNIARLYDAGVDPRGRPFMALEYVEGRPIDEFCTQRTLAVEARVQLLLQMADAVAFAHSRLVVHRDLKPGNVLVTADGQARLLDFGIAKLMEGDRTTETELTQVAGRALTLDYASPEQIRGEPIGTASDVYSLAVVAFQLLAGARPYRLKRESAAQLEEAIASIDAPLASEVAEDPALKQRLKGDLDAILNKALKKNAADRYPTVDAFAQDLRRHLAGQAVAARPDTLAYRLLRLARRYRLPLAAGGIVVAVFVLALGFGATAVVIGALAIGLGAALFLARRATAERDRAFALADRNAAVNVFLDTLLTRAARAGPMTAAQLLERSEQLIDNEIKDNAEHRAYVFGLLADYHRALDNPTRAAQLLERALEAARGIADEALRESLLGRRALVRGQLGELNEAIAATEAILARRSISPEVRSETHGHRSVLASFQGDQAGTLMHAIEALRWYRAARRLPPRQEAVLLGNLGWAYLMDGQGEQADRHFAEGAAAFEALGLVDSPQAVSLSTTWALAKQEMGDLPRSLELFDRSLVVGGLAAPDAPPSPYCIANRAYTLTQMGRYDEAETGYRRGAEVARQQGAPLIVYSIRMCLVELYAEQGRAEDGERELTEAKAECSVEVPGDGAAAFMRQLAEARLAMLRGQPEAAITVFTKAVEHHTPSAGTVNALLGRASAYAQAGLSDLAEIDAREALDFARRLQGQRPASFRTGLALLALAQNCERRGQAVETQRLAMSAREHLDATLDARHPARNEARRLSRHSQGALAFTVDRAL